MQLTHTNRSRAYPKGLVVCLEIRYIVLNVSKEIFLDSSMVEHTAVNRGVVGSSPTRGVKLERVRNQIWLLGQAVKTSPFHGGNTGSIPVGVT